MKCWLVRFSPPTQPTTHELQKQNVNKMSNFWHAQKLKTIRFKIFTLEIKWILYFFLAYLKIWNVSLQSILKTKTFFFKKVSFERIVEHGSVFSLLIFGAYLNANYSLKAGSAGWWSNHNQGTLRYNYPIHHYRTHLTGSHGAFFSKYGNRLIFFSFCIFAACSQARKVFLMEKLLKNK